MTRIAYRLGIAFGLLTAAPTMAQVDSLEQELSILADRFFLHFPKEAKNEPRSVDIMSAPPGEEEETRITWGGGDERLVFFAQEMSVIGTDDLAGDWKKALEAQGTMKFTVTELRKDPLVLRYAPENVATTGEAIFTAGIVVRCADGLLMNAQVYIDPKARERLADQQALIDRIFRSFRPGTRVMDPSARKVTLDKLSIDLPKDHFVTTDSAYDFVVHRVQRAAPLGTSTQASITLYFGRHPSLFSSEMGQAGAPEHVPGTLFGKPMEWLKVNDPAHGTYLMEQIVPIESTDGGAVAHVAVVGNDLAEVEAMVRIAEKMQLEQ